MALTEIAGKAVEVATKTAIEVGKKTKEIAGDVIEKIDETKYSGDLSEVDADKFMDSILDKIKLDDSDVDFEGEPQNPESNLEQTLNDYFDDLKSKSECPETIPDKPFDASELEKQTPEKTAEKREEFAEKKAELKKQWEIENGRPWPKYEHDVYSASGKLIRKAGSDYDAHHIQPLGMGGKNEVKNITPLNAEVHYDKQGVHSTDSPYSKLDKILGGIEE